MVDLHITNGDGAATIIKDSLVDGDVLPWRDTMFDGPFPLGLDLRKLSQGRARYFAGQGFDLAQIEREFEQRDEQLRLANTYDQIVLWFEHDLLDQLQILQLLDWFSGVDLGNTSLNIICIDRFSGIEPFRGLGQLDVMQMASLYHRREAVTPEQENLAREGWSAFRSPDPNALLTFLGSDLDSLPFLKRALLRHLEEYPSSDTGLKRTEWQILQLVDRGIYQPGSLFVANMNLETRLFIGDSATFRLIARLCHSDHPLLSCSPDGRFRYPPNDRISPDAFRTQSFELTKLGRQVLDGNIDAFDLIKRDDWLGGVHLRSERSMWVWNAREKIFRQRVPS